MSAGVFAVTLRATAEMVVWVEADSHLGAKAAAEAGAYDVMTDWEPRDHSKVRVASVQPSVWPPDGNDE